jgi:hypothetical protein
VAAVLLLVAVAVLIGGKMVLILWLERGVEAQGVTEEDLRQA